MVVKFHRICLYAFSLWNRGRSLSLFYYLDPWLILYLDLITDLTSFILVTFNIDVDGTSNNTLDSTLTDTAPVSQSSLSLLIEARFCSGYLVLMCFIPRPHQPKGSNFWMLLSLKLTVLAPFSLPMIGLGIVTHQGRLLGLWFSSG